MAYQKFSAWHERRKYLKGCAIRVGEDVFSCRGNLIGYQEDLMRSPGYGASTQADKEKLELLRESYARVLSAFTAQDERIGRLLTGVSFLTAAVLALAALNSATYAIKRFDMAPYRVPLPLAIVVVFLATIILAVLIMVSAVVGPIVLPIITRRLDRYEGRKDSAFVAKSSQLDYHEIAELSPTEWHDKWEKDDIGTIRKMREESMVRDIHRIAVRTAYKHDRGREAGAILRYSLLAFIAAVFIVGISANSKSDLISLKDYERLVLGLIFGSYFWLELMLSNRAEQQEVKTEFDESWLDVSGALRRDSRTMGSRPTRLLRQVFAASMFFFVVLSLLYIPDWPLVVFIVAEGALILVLIMSFIMMSRGSEVSSWRRLIVAVAILVPAFGVTFSEYNGWYVGQFASVWLASLILLATIVCQPTIAVIRRRRYREARQENAEQARWFLGAIEGPAVSGNGKPRAEAPS